eukprot:191025-Chlamydomonas_euryale.AAC.2
MCGTACWSCATARVWVWNSTFVAWRVMPAGGVAFACQWMVVVLWLQDGCSTAAAVHCCMATARLCRIIA